MRAIASVVPVWRSVTRVSVNSAPVRLSASHGRIDQLDFSESPGGGTPEKPAGTVCFAWAIRRDSTLAPWVRTTTRLFEGGRAAVRTQSIIEALDGLNVLLQQRLDV
jgi:hypothetical protein